MSQLEEIKARAEGHTPGPWEVHADTHEYRGGAFMQVEPKVGTRTVCEVTDQHKANAELIAAAPKLLAALEAVEAHHQPIPAGAYDGSKIQICATCSDDTGNWEIYPCPTLTGITEALQ